MKKAKYRDRMASLVDADTFGTLYDSMLKAESFQNLPIGAKFFYVCCRVQAQSKAGKQCLYKHAEENERKYNENYFVFPAEHLRLYGIDRSNARRMFDQLEKAGFVKKIESNQHQKKVNVYAFVDDWKNKT